MNKLFVAKFAQTNNEPFIADKNGNMPYIGQVLAGVANGSIINGTIFEREGLEPNKLYLCQNTVDEEYPDNVQTEVISTVSVTEFMDLRKSMGAGRIVLLEEAEEEATPPAEDDAKTQTIGKKAGKKAEKALV